MEPPYPVAIVYCGGSPQPAPSLSSQLVPRVPIGTLFLSSRPALEDLTRLALDVVTNPRTAAGARVPSAA
jgi:hypothetical protein